MKRLRSNGLRVKKVWIRSPHTLAYLLSLFLLKRGFYRVSSTILEGTQASAQSLESEKESKYIEPWDIRVNPWREMRPESKNTCRIVEKIPAVDSNSQLRSFWPFLELISVLPLILWRVVIPLFLGYTIVAERYIVDTIVTIGYFINDPRFLTSWTARFLLRFIPRNAVFIHLDSDYDTLLRRRGHNVEVRGYISFQRASYKHFDRILNPLIIDTSMSTPNETFTAIVNKLEECY